MVSLKRWRYVSPVEWTPTRISLLREVGLCLPQDKFAATLGFTKRTVGNAERGVHPPGLALRRTLDHTLEKASDAQRDRFLAAPPAHTVAWLLSRAPLPGWCPLLLECHLGLADVSASVISRGPSAATPETPLPQRRHTTCWRCRRTTDTPIALCRPLRCSMRATPTCRWS